MAGDNDKKGFGGFDDLVSDVSKELEIPAAKPKTQSTPRHSPESSTASSSTLPIPPSQQPKVAPIPQNTPGGKSGSGAAWGIGLLILFIIIAVLNSEKKEISSEPAPSYQPSYNSTEVAIDAAPAEPVSNESMPPVGRDLLLSSNQIRYCLSEEIRILTIDNILNKYSQLEIDKFNLNTNDYNSRCGQFKYRPGTLESVRSEVESNRSALVSEGLSRLASWRSPETADPPSYTPPPTYTPPSYSIDEPIDSSSSIDEPIDSSSSIDEQTQ